MFDPVVVIQMLLALISIVGFAYKLYNDSLKFSKISLEGIRSIIQRREEIDVQRRYIKDLEVSSVPHLRGFKWEEAAVILDKDIGISTLLTLRALAKKDLLAINDENVYIPNKTYLIKSYLKDPLAIISIIVFLSLFFLFLYIIFAQVISVFEYSIYLALLLVYEFLIIFQFDGLISYNLIGEKEDLSDNKIMISQDFDKVLELYKKSSKNLLQIDRRNDC